MFPRASWTNLLASSPMCVFALAASATATATARTVAYGNSTAGGNILGVAMMGFNTPSADYRAIQNASSSGIALLFNGGTVAAVIPHMHNSATGATPVVAINLVGDASSGAASLAVAGSISNGATFDLIRSANGAANTTGTGLQGTGLLAFDTTNWQRLKTNGAANIDDTVQSAQLGIAEAGEWAVDSSVAAAGTPSAVMAAGAAGVRHIARNLSISLANIGVVPTALITVVLRDGATGAGTVKRSWQFVIPASATINIDLAGLNIFGSAATAMTLESAAALPANVSGVCSLAGYSTI